MRTPVASVSCYDPNAPSGYGDLAARLGAAVADAGLTAWVTPADGTDGTVVVLEVSAGDLGLGPVEDTPGWEALSRRLGQALDQANPALALGGFHAVLDLDDPVWRTDRLDWCSGRAAVDHLDVDQRVAFNALVDDRLVQVRDAAVRWAARPGVPLGVGLIDVPPLGLAAATYQAWTGEVADLDPPSAQVDLAELNAPTVWLWAPQDLPGLAAAVASALPDYDVRVEDDYGPFGPVVAEPPTGRRSPAGLLADLRVAVTAARPAWAGLLIHGGILPPGVSPGTPGASIVDHLWLREDWAGAAVGQVTSALEPVSPERVGEGLLFTTGERGDRATELLWTPMVRYGRLCEAARVLGARVRAAVDGPDVEL